MHTDPAPAPRRPLRIAVSLGLLIAVFAGCGTDAEVATRTKRPTKTTVPPATIDSRFCDTFNDAQDPSELRGLVDPKLHPAIDALSAFATIDDYADNTPDDDALHDLQEALAADGAAGGLASLAAGATTTCADASVGLMLTAFATTAAMSNAPEIAPYCKELASMNDIIGGSDPTYVESLRASAPPTHRVGIEALAELMALPGDRPPEADLAARSAGAMWALGLYSQLTCGTTKAFTGVTMAAAVLFALISGTSDSNPDGTALSPEGGASNAESDALPPTPADAAAANSSTPPGSGLSFVVTDLVLEEDRGYHASVVHPAGWTADDGISVTLNPPIGSGWTIFEELRVSADCDGICAPTDWQSRLRGPDGYLTNLSRGSTVTVDRPVSGSPGVVIQLSTSSGDVKAAVVRWLDGASRYFRCEVELEAERASLLDAFVAACEASRPGWIPVS